MELLSCHDSLGEESSLAFKETKADLNFFVCYIGIYMEQRSLGTHDGTFHADEITACALLMLFDRIDRDKIVRTRDLSILEHCEYVCDVGGVYDPRKKRFDHHQASYSGHLSSAGMVWLYLLDEKVIQKSVYDFFNRVLIWGVDAHDNGKVTVEPGICSFSQIISHFVPFDHAAPSEKVNRAFFEALDFAYGHVKRLLDRYYYAESCRDSITKAMERGNKYLILDCSIPWMDAFFDLGGEHHPALFIVMPSGPHWKLRGIPPNTHDRMKVRLPLPEDWAGLMDNDLKRVSGITGAIFCHKGRFISVWQTKEDALKALELVLGKKA